jgi:hypothetical protein
MEKIHGIIWATMPGADARVKYIEDRRLVEVAEVNVQNCWRRGRLRALSLLRAAEDGEEPLYTLEEVDFKGWAESGADMFKPRGVFVGMSGDDVDDEDANIDPRCDADVLAALEEGESTRELEAAMDEVVAKYVPDRKVYKVKDATGTDVNLDTVCRKMRKGFLLRKTVARTGRVAGVPKAGSKAPVPRASGEEGDDSLIAGCDPVFFFFGSKEGVSVAVGVVEHFASASGSKGLAEISAAALADPNASATVLVMKALVVSEKIRFDPSKSCGVVEVAGVLVQPLNPDLVDSHVFELGLLEMQQAMDVRWSSICDAASTQKALKKTTLSALPYRDDSGVALFVCAGTEGSSPPTGTADGLEQRVVCAIVDCGQVWSAKAMRQHMGFHLLFEREKVPALMPCGFCGGESAQNTSDRTQLTGCAVWLVKGQPRMHCQLFGGDVKYTMGTAKKSSKASPCTNVPLLCATCPQKPGVVHWKLNMIAHYDRSHAGVVAAGTKKETETTQAERDWVEIVGGNRGTVPSK